MKMAISKEAGVATACLLEAAQEDVIRRKATQLLCCHLRISSLQTA